ncbi:hypothetical protein LWF15_26560 [Kineosporia rhizophila]|uniref:hypothetical protein n=1 Tax=Kineosporia rhizophila TaxID=84633 RepID=UPI001E4D3AF3|nr:hypothetical protein [Kineosporia rhizophila]MCE0539067.1 hypothetical protein [Kineosporia rhizophila]
MRLIGEDETSKAMQAAGAAAGSLSPDPDATVRAAQPGAAELLSTAGLPDVTGDLTDTGLQLSAASVGAALAATGAPLNMASVSSSSSGEPAQGPASGSLPTPGADSTEPHAYVPDPASSPVSPPTGNPLGGPPAFGTPSPQGGPRSVRTPDTGAFVPREVLARRRAAEAMTRAIVMAPPLPPSMMTGAMQAPGLAQPTSGAITQPGAPGTSQTQVDHAAPPPPARPAAKSRKRKGRKHGAHTAGIPLADPASTPQTAPTPQQPPTGPMSMPAPGTAGVPMGYPAQGYPQGYAPQGYVPQPGYAPQGYVPQGYAPQGYVPQPGYAYQPNVPTGAMPVSAMGSVGMPTAPPQHQAPPTNPGPSKSTRWALLAAVVLVIGGLVGGVLYSNRGPDDAAKNAGASVAPTPSASATQAAPTVALNFEASSFAERDSGIEVKGGGVFKSEGYNAQDFAGLKDGVGLMLDLGSAKKVSSVSFDVGGAPVTVGLRAGDEYTSSDLGAFSKKVVPQGEKTGKVTFDASSEGAHQYWLIWVTGPALRSDGRYGVTLTDLKVTGPKG